VKTEVPLYSNYDCDRSAKMLILKGRGIQTLTSYCWGSILLRVVLCVWNLGRE